MLSGNDISLSENDISLKGNDISPRNKTIADTIYRSIYRLRLISIWNRQYIAIFIDYRLHYFWTILYKPLKDDPPPGIADVQPYLKQHSQVWKDLQKTQDANLSQLELGNGKY